jgi:ribosomal protein S18 acetylase RimI-like enzyme
MTTGQGATGGGEILVRRMAAEDRPAVAALLLDLNRVENALTGDRHVSAHAGHECLVENERCIAESGGALLVAERRRSVVGALLLAFETSDAFIRPDLRSCTRILDLCVDEAHRGAGVGRRLLQEAERIAREQGHAALLIGALAANRRALALYEAVGFRTLAVELRKPLRSPSP